jgi:hypothetical protein
VSEPGYYVMPPQPQGSPIVWNYDIMKKEAGKLAWYTQVKLDLGVALTLTRMSPYPSGVKLGVMKQVANDKAITLRQMGILLGWAADRAQR